MLPKRGRRRTRRSVRDKPEPRNICIEEESIEEDVKFKTMLRSIRPHFEEIKKSMDTHLWKQEHEFECTILGKLEKMYREMAFFQIKNKRFKGFLHSLLKASQEESERIRTALHAVNSIRSKRLMILGGLEIGPYLNFNDYIKDIGKSVPLWMGVTNEVAPPYCGAIPPPDDHEFKFGHMVAAHVIMDDPEPEVFPELGIIGKWFLCVVLGLNGDLYSVRDIDGTGTVYEVPKTKVIPLPLFITDPETNPEAIYPVDSLVLALYTGTTCFFPGIVTGTPKNKEEHYIIRFRDSNDDAGWGSELKVEQQFVIPYKDVYTIINEKEREDLISYFGNSAVMPLKTLTPNVVDNNNVPIDEE